MLIVPIEEAREGMVLTAPVTHPDLPDQDLLKRGYALEKPVIDRLRELHVESLFVDYPGLEDLDRHLESTLSPARQMMYGQIKETIKASERRAQPAVSYRDYYRSTHDLVLTLLNQGQHPVYLDAIQRMGSDAIAHGTAVAHLSLLLGLKLESYLITERKRLRPHHAKDVVNLGVAGMLHDMGKLKLAEELRDFTTLRQPESPENVKQWQEHARLGYEAIREGVEPTAAAAVLHHHQRFDGRGFPRLARAGRSTLILDGHCIHIFPRIIAVADLYDRLSVPTDSHGRRSNLEILSLLQERFAAWCDPTVLAMMAVVCPPFPPGSQVTLSDGTRAVVVDVPPNNPYVPIVRRYSPDGKTLDNQRVELRKEGQHIVAMGSRSVDVSALPPLPTSRYVAASTIAAGTTLPPQRGHIYSTTCGDRKLVAQAA